MPGFFEVFYVSSDCFSNEKTIKIKRSVGRCSYTSCATKMNFILNCFSFLPDFVRKKITDTQNAVDKISTTFAVKTIYIGSYKFEPKEKVVFSSLGMRIIAPNTKRDNENVILDIQKSEIVKICCHLSSSLAVLFIYTTRSCGLYVRESLEMVRSSDIFYDPSAANEHNKRIVLHMDNLSEEAKTTIKSIFSNEIIDEINHNDAVKLLERSSRNNKAVKSDTNAASRYAIFICVFFFFYKLSK